MLFLKYNIYYEYIQAQIKAKTLHLLNLTTSLGSYQADTQFAKNKTIFNIL